MKILNLGCGEDMYGTHRIDFTQTKATTDLCNFDKEKLPYPDNFFDEIKCQNVIEHIKNLDLFVSEIYRVLKKNGIIKLRTDFAGYLPMYVLPTHEHNKLMKYEYINQDGHHYHIFVESHLRWLFKDFAFIKVNYVLGGRNKINKFLMRILPFKLGCLHIGIEGYK
jgi:ubiquinone/menaquinone biosynthesis C-methylase UbiE